MDLVKTSDNWLKDKNFRGLDIKDFTGWPKHPEEFNFHFYQEKIDYNEFLHRLSKCKFTWSFSRYE